MNIIAVGKADFVQNEIPVSQVGTNIDTVGYVRKYISISEVGMNIIAEGRADFVRQKKTSFGKRSRLVILVML